MKLTKKIETEICQVYDTWLDSYLNGDVATYDKYLDKDYHFIGSTNNEEFLSKKDTTNFFKATADQLAGKTQLRNETKVIEKFEELVFVTHLFDAWFLNGTDWAYYGRFRFTNALKNNKEGWRFIYQHFSTTDSKAQEGETIGFDQISAENLQLREAVKRRTIELEEKNRELEVETALERIRSQAVAMQESSDLLDIVVTMRNEFIKLGHEAGYFWHMMWLPATYEKAMTSGDGSKIGFVMKLPRHIHGDIPQLAKWEKSKKPTIVYAMNVEETIDYVDKMVNLGDFQNIDPQAPSHDDIRHIGGLTFIMARTSHGEIGYSLPGIVENPPKEDIDILVKFAGAFDLAHRRFLDLQKSEKQAREVQIELALERVRSRTMGMQRSDELRDTALLLFQQVEKLGINSFACGFNIWDDDKKFATAWMATKDRLQPPFKTNSAEDVYLLFHQAEKRGESLFVLEQKGKKLEEHYKYLVTIPEIKKLNEAGLSFPTFQIIHCAYFTKGYLMFITHEPVPDAHDIFKRFAKVFQQTYTRFLDLQKAEAQAKEAQIEAALERVRSRSMAMHNSEELNEVIQVLYDQFVHLNINIEHAGFILDYKENDDMHIWLADQHAVFPEITLPYFECAHWNSFNEAKKKGHNFFTNQLGFEEKNKFYKDLFEFIPELPEETKTTYFKFDGLAISTVLLENIGLYIENYSGNPFSDEENSILMRFAKVFEQTYTRFLDLQKAEAQARESQIEAALERVRSRSMAMHKSDELVEVVRMLDNQINGLGIENNGSQIITDFINPEKGLNSWPAVEGQLYLEKFRIPYIDHPITSRLLDALKKGTEFYTEKFSKTEKNNYLRLLFKVSDLKKTPKERQEFLYTTSGWVRSVVIFKNSILIFQRYNHIEYSEAENNIFQRFGKVFEQAYTRFLDLQKAEAQAKEAQIEAALERVRSRSMAMHKSDEMLEVIEVVSKQLLQLNLKFDIVYFGEKNQEGDFRFWIASKGQPKPLLLQVPFLNTRVLNSVQEAQKNGINFIENVFTAQENKEWSEHMFKFSESKYFPKEVKGFILNAPGFARSSFLLKGIHLYVGNYRAIPFTKEENAIFSRFAQVFEQAYTRFLDLQKAEAQAKEAQIEAALEKVRSRSLAMHQSEELWDVVSEIFLQLETLKITADSCFINIYQEASPKDIILYVAAGGQTYKYRTFLPYTDNKMFNRLIEARKNKESFYSIIMDKADKDLWWKYFFDKATNIKVPIKRKNYIAKTTGLAQSVVLGEYASIHMMKYIAIPYLEAENQILMRFGKAFDQVYTRFLDLQKAEAQAREALIETSLERVRSRTLAMQNSEELAQTSVVVFQQLLELGIAPNRLFIGIIKEDGKKIDAWATNEDGSKLASQFTMQASENKSIKKILDGWKQKKKSLIIDLKGKELQDYFHYLNEEIDLPFIHGLNQKRRVQTIAYFSGGLIGMAAPEEQPKKTVILLERFAAVFNLTYTRFNDLKIAEANTEKAEQDLIKLQAAKKRAEDALSELQTTQTQLIQSEKMASLGELTAGIAHEIQNPLNFVNNFSEVSKELLQEMLEEIENGDMEEVKAIMDDVIQNLEKINHHGKRADGIVKGMLQHSRSSTGIKEPIDINVLADEYLRLAYHGLRAKDKSFNATLVTDFDDTIGNINIISQDIGRVVLNLLTNAFYACTERSRSMVNEKKQGNQNDYKPTVTLTTKKNGNKVSISVKDNGNGIPKQVLEKIFQPFFTTKPTGQGTGLGLSMSYDIVTKGHGGELKVSTKDGEGTTFTIQLPITN